MALTSRPPSAWPVGDASSVDEALTVRAEGTRTIVALRGEANLSTRHVLADALSRVIAVGGGDVVIDLAQANCIDTATIRVLEGTQGLLHRRGHAMVFRSPSGLAAQLLDLVGLTDLIEARSPRQR